MNIVFIIEVLGTIAFALSGAIVAIQNRYDIFGIAVLSFVTALGGGIMRDIILGSLPPVAFVIPVYFFTALITSVLTMVVFKIIRKDPFKNKKIEFIFYIFDSVGLAMFTISGVNIAIASGYLGNGFLVTFLGVLTGVGGGVLRDVLARRRPVILRKHIYAVASVAGAIVYYVLYRYIINSIAIAISVCFIILLRLLAIKFEWNLPKVS
jgi:uncharacterized membrane protein YeiH